MAAVKTFTFRIAEGVTHLVEDGGILCGGNFASDDVFPLGGNGTLNCVSCFDDLSVLMRKGNYRITLEAPPWPA